MRILYLAHRIPYPPDKGDKIRSYHEVRHLSRSHDVDLACLVDDPADFRHEAYLKGLCRRVALVPLDTRAALLRGAVRLATGKPLSVGYFYSPPMQQTVDRWLDETAYGAIVCFSSPMAEYILRSRVLGGVAGKLPEGSPLQTAAGSPRLIMDFCDVDSDKWAQYAEDAPFPKSLVYALEHRRLAAYERMVTERFHRSVFVSGKEAELFQALNPQAADICVVPNGVDHRFFDPDAPDASEEDPSKVPAPPGDKAGPILLFTGAMDYHANIDGVVWFARKVLPRIQSVIPGVRFLIVGRNPHRDVLNLAENSSIRVTGYVEDIRPWYRSADVCVVPLRLARGVQNKVLEAMSMARPVVATSKALEGIEAEPGRHILVEDSAEGFAGAVLSILSTHDAGAQLGQNARRHVLQSYDWESKMQLLSALLQAS